MKDKPVSHKNLNTFRFQTFSERISSINIDVIRQFGKVSSSPDDVNTFLGEAFEKWSELNYTLDYKELCQDVAEWQGCVNNDKKNCQRKEDWSKVIVEILTLSEIVFRKDELIEIFLKHLNKEGSLALDAILELIVALARDLQYEFYPYFPKFFNAITVHLSTKDTDLLEKLFTGLAYLFKFLWRYMVKDMENVYRMFSSLLSDTNKEHIRIFAVESFAFLIRKVQDKENFLLFIFTELEKNPEQYLGVGQLLFEVLKGVKQQFHSCTELILKLLLKFLGNKKCSADLVEQSLIQMFTAMAKHTVQTHCIIIQNVFCDFIKELLTGINLSEGNGVIKPLDRVLHLLFFWINFKKGKLITSENYLIKTLSQLCNLENLPDCSMKSVADIISSIMISSCVNLPVDAMRKIITRIFSHSEEIVFYFTRKMYFYGMFEKDILPVLMSECLKMLQNPVSSNKANVLKILSETVITLRPVTLCFDDVVSFSKLYFYPSGNVSKKDKQSSTSESLENYLLEVIQSNVVATEKLCEFWSALLCLPHLRLINKDAACERIQNLSKDIQKYLIDSESVESQQIEKCGFVLLNAYYSFLIIWEKEKEETCFTTNFFIQLLKKFPSSVSVLRIVDLYMNSKANSAVIENVMDIISVIISNLSSPYHMVRLYTLKLLKDFISSSEDSQSEAFISVLSICHEAEKIPIDVQKYREKLKWLRKLEYGFIEKDIPINFESILIKAIVHYLIGMLYVNFKLLWDPSFSLLESFAHGKSKLFWDVFGPHLENIINLCAEFNCGLMTVFVKWEDNNKDIFCHEVKSFCKPEENPDLLNHRVLLWKAMEHFPDIVETKNRMIVPLLFQFMSKEVNKIETLMASTEDIKRSKILANDSIEFVPELEDERGDISLNKKRKRKTEKQIKNKKCKHAESTQSQFDLSSNADQFITDDEQMSESIVEEVDAPAEKESDLDVSASDIDDSDAEDEDQETTTLVSSKNKIYLRKKHHIAKSLAAYLSVFSKFRNPKGGYKADELESLYRELLCYYDPVIQKLAFDCILTFNYKFLSPYKDNFYRILDNKTFKTEIVLFNLDIENEVIQEEHRMNTLSVLMRILYGKMLHKTGNNTTGKAQANIRRSLVLRFLAGCKAVELKMFFELVFLPFKEQLNDDVLIAVKKIRENLDLSSVVPIKRQHSALNSLGLIFQHLGNLIPELLPWLFKVLLIITTNSATLLERREEVLPQCINILKSVRILAVMKLIQFFQTFKTYMFEPEEIDAVFHSIVWIMLPRLETESVNQPSPLLRLLATWSDNQRYFIFFSKQHETIESLTPLPYIMNLYCSSQAKSRVIGVISKMIFQLLSAEEEKDEEGNQLPPLKVNCCIPLLESPGADVTFGTKLLLPYVDKILLRFEMTATALSQKRVKKSLSIRDLNILLKISNFVSDPKLCFKLIQLLTPFLLKGKLSSDSEVLILNTITNLLKKSENPDYFIKLFSPLFAKLVNQNSRIALVSVFSTMAEIRPEMEEMKNIVAMINSYDSTLVEEPDYQQRLDGHNGALNIIRAMDHQTFNENFIRIIIFNSSFVIRNSEDIALRNSATYVLQEVTKSLSSFRTTLPELVKTLLFETLLPEIQKGLKVVTESVRHEFIMALSTVLQNFKDLPNFKELVSLCHDDRELDFWENIRHLQVHRRARALLRFANILKDQNAEDENVPLHYLLLYMMPIVTSFFFDSAYKKHVHVTDAAIETLGCIASVLPWHHYEPLLKQYLQLLTRDVENHKTIVRIIVSLLNAFHFDVTNVVDSSTTNQNKEIAMQGKDEETDHKIPEDAEVTIIEQDKSLAEEPAPVVSDPNRNSRIYNSIKKNILPLLHRSLMKKNKSDSEHKLAGHYYPEDEEILRVPIALAMVKLLQKLPPLTLEQNLPGLFLKMCDLLKTRTESIRETTRDTLIKMMQSVGPKHFKCLLSQMKGVMKKGYQVHVMTFTLNACLTSIADQINSCDLDTCMDDLVQVCMNELFTDHAEEKEVAKITAKLKEARSIKSYSIFQVLSKNISGKFLSELIKPLKEVLAKRHSHKIMKKVSECLRHIALGISENKGISSNQQLLFIHAVVNESLPEISRKKKPILNEPTKYERPDVFLVPKEPGRSGPPAKINEKTTGHVLVEFGLQLFHFCLKKDKIEKDKKEVLQMLDPFILLLSDCLQSNHIKIVTAALRCLLPLYKYPLPSFKTVTKKIVDSLFILVNKYAAIGMGQGDNFEMIVMCFKMFTTLVRDFNYHKMNEEQLQSLLSYIEQDIHDYTRQATAFTLLKAILSKKLQAPGLKGIMSKVAEMSVTSEKDYVRTQCRQACLQYMLDYPLGKQLEKPMSFFIGQLDYSLEPGRISALETINSMMTTFPENVLKKYSSLFLIPLAVRLVNDESPGCRKMSAQCIKKLLNKIEHDGRLTLFSIAFTWLQDKKVSHKRLGAQLFGIFAEVEGEQFEHHMHKILPLLTDLIITSKDMEVKSHADERSTDHFLYHVLNALAKMLSYCPIIKKEEFSDAMNVFWDAIQGLILHPHVWIRLSVCQLFGLLLSTFTIEEIQIAICDENKSNSVYLNTRQKLRDLSADFCTQLQSPYLNEKLGEQVIRNLVYLSKVIAILPEQEVRTEIIGDMVVEECPVEVTLDWIIRRLCREVKKEVAEQPSNSQRRKYIFMFLAAVTNEIGKEKILPLLNTILLPLCREICDNSKHTDADLKKNAQEVLDLIQNVVGVEEFTNIYANVQILLHKKKAKRKQEKAVEAITNPQKYAQKRIKKQKLKKESKKRKIMKIKGKRKVTKTKLSDLVIGR